MRGCFFFNFRDAFANSDRSPKRNRKSLLMTLLDVKNENKIKREMKEGLGLEWLATSCCRSARTLNDN